MKPYYKVLPVTLRIRMILIAKYANTEFVLVTEHRQNNSYNGCMYSYIQMKENVNKSNGMLNKHKYK